MGLPSTEALRGGKLTFWVSSRWPSQPTWNDLVADLKNDYPDVEVEWKAFQRDAFLPALSEALHNRRAPDVVFVDNYAQEGPLIQRQSGRIMAGLPRHMERGWWTILNDAPDRKVAEAFFIWLAQPKDWQPPRPATQLLTADDKAKISSIARETIEAFGALPAQPPQDVLESGHRIICVALGSATTYSAGRETELLADCGAGGRKREAGLRGGNLAGEGRKFIRSPSLVHGFEEEGTDMEGALSESKRIFGMGRADGCEVRRNRNEQ